MWSEQPKCTQIVLRNLNTDVVTSTRERSEFELEQIRLCFRLPNALLEVDFVVRCASNALKCTHKRNPNTDEKHELGLVTSTRERLSLNSNKFGCVFQLQVALLGVDFVLY